MNNVLRAEFFKLRTQRVLMWIALGAVVALSVAGGIYAGFTSDPIDITGPDLLETIGTFAVLVSLATGVAAALAISTEFRLKTIRQTLLATPQRGRVFSAKAIVVAVYGLVVGALAAACAYGIGTAIADSRGGVTGLSGDDGSLVTLIGVVLISVMMALFGYGVGLLVRSVPAAVAITILWPVAVERVLAILLAGSGVDGEDRFLPYRAATSMLSPTLGADAPGRIYGGVLFAGVSLALVIVGVEWNKRRDV